MLPVFGGISGSTNTTRSPGHCPEVALAPVSEQPDLQFSFCIFQFAQPLAKSRPPGASEWNGPKSKAQVGGNQSVSARQFAIFILQFSFCNSLFNLQFPLHFAIP